MRRNLYRLSIVFLVFGFFLGSQTMLDARRGNSENATRRSEPANQEVESPKMSVPGSSSGTYELFQEGEDAKNATDYSKALACYSAGFERSERSNDRKWTGIFLSRMGQMNMRLGRYKKAWDCYQKALSAHRENQDQAWEGRTLNGLGELYSRLGQYEKALKYLHKALLALKTVHGTRLAEAGTLNNLGVAYQMLGQYDKALEYYEKALPDINDAIAKHGRRNTKQDLAQKHNAFRETHARLMEGVVLDHIGQVYQDLGQTEKALKYYKSALSAHRRGNHLRWGESRSLTDIGLLYCSLGKEDLAGQALNEAHKIAIEMGDSDVLWRILSGLGQVEATQGKDAAAISYYEHALESIESTRSEFSEEQEIQSSFMKNKIVVYDKFIDLLQTLHKKNPSMGYEQKALEVFERKQGRFFLEQMGKSGVRHFAGLPEDIATREAELENELAELQRDRSGASEEFAADETRISEKITQVKADQKALEDKIRGSYPDYYALKYPKPASLSELQRDVLKQGEVMMIYGVADKVTCLWVVGKNDFKLFSIAIGEKELREKVNRFGSSLLAVLDAVQKRYDANRLKLVVADSMPGLRDQGYELYSLLVPEAAAGIITKAGLVYVVPTESLYALPFEALTTKKVTGGKEFHFLVEDHSFSYLSSASLLKLLREAKSRKQDKPANPLIAFANPVYGEKKPGSKGGVSRSIAPDEIETAGDTSSLEDLRGIAKSNIETAAGASKGGSFPELPETEDEVKKVATILLASGQSRPLQLRDAASKSNVLLLNDEKKLEGYRFVVFACHGILPGEVDRVKQPALILSDPDPKTGKDGFLTMADVFGLKLNADLVTLSACNTGRGEAQKGEGIKGLTRAFMYAGTSAVSSTLWSVESRSAVVLNTGFYANLKAAKSRAEALRGIKLRMIRGEEGDLYRHPYYWAPVVVFGDGQ
jgi:CHAT domain-containing protein/Tfp pilus assembly protein PilF